jgi:hypothetical protein
VTPIGRGVNSFDRARRLVHKFPLVLVAIEVSHDMVDTPYKEPDHKRADEGNR